jgi:predicted nucleic acid-binding Zn ribbon protein
VSDTPLETKLAVHEAICSERYSNIATSLKDGDKRMTKIEYLLYAVIIVVLLGPGVGAEFVRKLLGL